MPRHPPCTLSSLISFMWVILEEIVFYIYPLRKNFKISFFFTHHCFALFNFQSTLYLNAEFGVRSAEFFIPYSSFCILHSNVVGLSGLEPPTSRLSGVRSNRLSYKPIWFSWCAHSFPLWWRWGGSNSWPPACKAGALPAELHPHLGSKQTHIGIDMPYTS